ncbi:hypothetical protein GB937_000853 [Aspergillus fischeri]|nr:hypothetical protein GB937_000853 [Aspergillus fischeri]
MAHYPFSEVMTRTTSVEDVKFEIPAWENSKVDVADGSGRPESSASGDTIRPKGRIRRSMTACNTCRKLKTRCDLDPRGHACRRCLSLRIECKLPETAERFQDNASMWSDATAAIPSIEERLISLERSMTEMTSMMRQMMDRSPSISGSSVSMLTRSGITDETASIEGSQSSSFAPRPIRLLQDLQSDFVGEANVLPADSRSLGDPFTKGIIDPKLSQKLIQLFVDHFGIWISVDNPSDIHNELRATDPLLYSTACLLASRYVPGIPLSVIHAMYLQIRHAAVNVLWNNTPLKHETLQALTLLALWPTAVQKETPMDSWLLSGISINHAIISFDFLNHAPAELIVDNDMVAKLRVWNALCLTQLQSAIGNARPFHIQQRYLEHCPRLLEHPAATFEDGKIVAEIQLYLIALKLQNFSHRMRLGDFEYEEIERWKMEWAHLLTGEQHSTLELSLWYCQLLLYRTAMRFHWESEHLISEILRNSRLILSKFLLVRFPNALAFPDQIYYIVGYAALNLCDFSPMDPLIDQVQTFLLHLSPNEDHIAYRFSYTITELKRRCAAGPNPHNAVKGAFGDTRKLSMGQQIPFINPLMDTMMGEYGGLEHLIPEVPPHSLPDMLTSVAGELQAFRTAIL